jgi:hypothetical protein
VKIEAACSSETSIDFQQALRRYISKARTVHISAGDNVINNLIILRFVRTNLTAPCHLVVGVPDYRSRVPGDSRHYQIFREVVGLERGLPSLVRSYLKEKVAALV